MGFLSMPVDSTGNTRILSCRELVRGGRDALAGRKRKKVEHAGVAVGDPAFHFDAVSTVGDPLTFGETQLYGFVKSSDYDPQAIGTCSQQDSVHSAAARVAENHMHWQHLLGHLTDDYDSVPVRY